MRRSHILLDTSVLSEARRAVPVEEVARFLRELPRKAIAVPTWTIFELERGAQMLRLVDEPRAAPLLAWLDDLLDTTDVFVPPVGPEIHRIIARMTLAPALRRFWVGSGGSTEMRFGSDPGIAAVAIHYGMPIATRDIRDFMLIHSHFPLPGVYDPYRSRWYVEPMSEWRAAFERSRIEDAPMMGG